MAAHCAFSNCRRPSQAAPSVHHNVAQRRFPNCQQGRARSVAASAYPFGSDGEESDVKTRLKSSAEARMEEIVARVRVSLSVLACAVWAPLCATPERCNAQSGRLWFPKFNHFVSCLILRYATHTTVYGRGHMVQIDGTQASGATASDSSDMVTLRDSIRSALGQLTEGLVERDTEARLMLLAAMSGEHVLFLSLIHI